MHDLMQKHAGIIAFSRYTTQKTPALDAVQDMANVLMGYRPWRPTQTNFPTDPPIQPGPDFKLVQAPTDLGPQYRWVYQEPAKGE